MSLLCSDEVFDHLSTFSGERFSACMCMYACICICAYMNKYKPFQAQKVDQVRPEFQVPSFYSTPLNGRKAKCNSAKEKLEVQSAGQIILYIPYIYAIHTYTYTHTSHTYMRKYTPKSTKCVQSAGQIILYIPYIYAIYTYTYTHTLHIHI